MNRFLTSFCLLLLISCGQGQQQPSQKTPDTTGLSVRAPAKTIPAPPPDSVALIRGKVQKINAMKLTAKHVEFMCDEKMMVDYFYAKGELVKIAVDFGTVGDVYAKETYYYDSGKLIFNYEFVEGGPACEGCIKKDEYRSYVWDNKVIKYLKNKTEAACRTCEFSTSSRQYKLLQAETGTEMKKILCGF